MGGQVLRVPAQATILAHCEVFGLESWPKFKNSKLLPTCSAYCTPQSKSTNKLVFFPHFPKDSILYGTTPLLRKPVCQFFLMTSCKLFSLWLFISIQLIACSKASLGFALSLSLFSEFLNLTHTERTCSTTSKLVEHFKIAVPPSSYIWSSMGGLRLLFPKHTQREREWEGEYCIVNKTARIGRTVESSAIAASRERKQKYRTVPAQQ